jgi:putative ATP-dependent endonuclease of OLD family
LIDFDYIKEGISIVRCGSKDEIDRFYRLYVEFGIPSFVMFDGDVSLKGTPKAADNIRKNKAILELFGNSDDYPAGEVLDLFLGFEEKFEEELGFATTKKGLELFIEVKEHIKDKGSVPEWVDKVVEKVKSLPEKPKSVLRKPGEGISTPVEDIPF